ncbi:MAG TPA: hypothetical protein VJ911_03800 [Cryomorphaceae bacterium]|nr:hypothetical protein [Cryomorphaceae bacterium]
MIRITRDNYEAFFLDYIEGNLDGEGAEALDAFLRQNLDLRHELDDAEILPLHSEASKKRDWSNLKQAGNLDFYLENPKARDALFVKHIDGETNTAESALVDVLLTRPELKEAYAEWKTLLLLPGKEETDKNALYRFASSQPVSHSNFEDFLIAFAEGELHDDKIEELKVFAERVPNGLRALELAKNLRLTPAEGIFFPDRESLYRKENRIIPMWFYRTAAVAAILLLGVFTWNIADRDTVSSPQPIAETNESQPVDSAKSTPSIIPVPVDSSAIAVPETNLDEAREAPLNKHRQPESQYAQLRENELEPERNRRKTIAKPLESKSPITLNRNIQPALADVPQMAKRPSRSVEIASKSETIDYKTIGELSEDFLAKRFEIQDQKRDELALAVAKKVTDKAGEILDAEFKKTPESDTETTSYMLRIGQFKVSHTKGN